MKILLDKKKLTFDITVDNNNMIKINDNKIQYNEYLKFLKNSLNYYISYENENVEDLFDNYFTYFKITTNPLVKENMTSKLLYLIVNTPSSQISLFKNNKIKNLIDSYLYHNNDRYLNYIKITLKIINIEEIKNDYLIEFDNETFDLLDFIIDYYI